MTQSINVGGRTQHQASQGPDMTSWECGKALQICGVTTWDKCRLPVTSRGWCKPIDLWRQRPCNTVKRDVTHCIFLAISQRHQFIQGMSYFLQTLQECFPTMQRCASFEVVTMLQISRQEWRHKHTSFLGQPGAWESSRKALDLRRDVIDNRELGQVCWRTSGRALGP